MFEDLEFFFRKKFKKKFIIIASVPVCLSLLYLIEITLIPGFEVNDQITGIRKITISSNNGAYRTSRNMGYRHYTEKEYKFSTLSKRIGFKNVEMTVSPITQTVKRVSINGSPVKISSGFKGTNKVLLIIVNCVLILSIAYALLIRQISDNARLNLIFLNLFLLMVWLYILVLL